MLLFVINVIISSQTWTFDYLQQHIHYTGESFIVGGKLHDFKEIFLVGDGVM